jgi:hypothetical protein
MNTNIIKSGYDIAKTLNDNPALATEVFNYTTEEVNTRAQEKMLTTASVTVITSLIDELSPDNARELVSSVNSDVDKVFKKYYLDNLDIVNIAEVIKVMSAYCQESFSIELIRNIRDEEGLLTSLARECTEALEKAISKLRSELRTTTNSLAAMVKDKEKALQENTKVVETKKPKPSELDKLKARVKELERDLWYERNPHHTP